MCAMCRSRDPLCEEKKYVFQVEEDVLSPKCIPRHIDMILSASIAQGKTHFQGEQDDVMRALCGVRTGTEIAGKVFQYLSDNMTEADEWGANTKLRPSYLVVDFKSK